MSNFQNAPHNAPFKKNINYADGMMGMYMFDLKRLYGLENWTLYVSSNLPLGEDNYEHTIC